eukprot:augustus_masked-scaffold_15-processed-gene-3.30-mRNA-1 protein AED:0.42 eAED:0.43 QI:0/-1/0/1/-1/1/1/0/569
MNCVLHKAQNDKIVKSKTTESSEKIRNLQEAQDDNILPSIIHRLRNKMNSRLVPEKEKIPDTKKATTFYLPELGNNVTAKEVYDLLQPIIDKIEQKEYDLSYAIDEAWVIVSGIGIFAMQLGFSLLESGTVESKAVKSVLMKNLNDNLFGGCVWYIFGYGLYVGDNVVAGGDPNAFVPTDVKYLNSLFQQFGFSVTACTIVSGAIVGRVRFESYVMYSCLFLAYVYPLAAHWCWSDNAWLGDLGYTDFAGGGIIHGLGGVAALVGAYISGPRVGRYYPLIEGQRHPIVRPMKPNSVVLINLGGLLLYINWFFFNCGSSLGLSDPAAYTAAATAAVNTLVCSVFAGVTTCLYQLIFTNVKEVEKIINSVLAGLVAVTSGCASINPFASMVLGILTSGFYLITSWYLVSILLIDDPLDAFAIHGASGMFGVIVIGFAAVDGGIIYGGDSSLLVAQVIGATVLSVWGFVNSFILFMVVKFSIGLTVSKEEQAVGLDLIHHDAAINELDSVQVQEYALRKDLENRMIQRRKRDREEKARKESSAGPGTTIVGKMKKTKKKIVSKVVSSTTGKD